MPELFGHMPSGEPVFRVAIGSVKLRVHVLTFGAVLQSIELPGPDGGWTNVVMGLTTLEDYVARSPHFGAVPGRYAGRIAGGRFTLDGVEYRLPTNNGPNTLHGGPHGFGKRAWTLADAGPTHVRLSLLSQDGDAGFPGTLRAEVTYTIESASIRIDYRAETDRPTVVNLTNHSYFNLSGEGSGSVVDHRLTIEADEFAPNDASSIPVGPLRGVDGTPFDFRSPRALGARIREADPQLLMALGYDHAYVLRGSGFRRVACLEEPGSGRRLVVSSTAPSLQLYTGNTLTGALAGPSGRAYRQSDAVCLEAQHFPDSPNQPRFPTTVLRPGKPFAATTLLDFAPGGV